MKLGDFFSLAPIVLASSLLPTQVSAAQFNTAVCNDCSITQMKNKAIRNLPRGGEIHILDINNVSAVNFLVEYQNPFEHVSMSNSGAEENSSGSYFVEKIPTESDVQKAIEEIARQTDILRGFSEGKIDETNLRMYYVGPSRITSAHAVASADNPKHYINQALSKFMTENVFATLVGAIATVGQSAVSAAIPTNIPFTVVFDDNTPYQFKITSLQLDPVTSTVSLVFDAIIGSGSDGGNLIPESDKYKGLDVSGNKDMIERYVHEAQLVTGMEIDGTNVLSTTGSGGSYTLSCITHTKCTLMFTPH